MTERVSSEDLVRALEFFWHPLATIPELQRAGGLFRARILGRDLVVALLDDGQPAALVDRCPHRSTRLSVGRVEGTSIRCAYHGWRWDRGGRCVEIPSTPGSPIPGRFRQEAFETAIAYGLVWVRLRGGAATVIPECPAAADPTMRMVAGDPYTWPTSAPRRVENFVDLAHFAWVHDGTLGRRDGPVPPPVEVSRVAHEMRFSFTSPEVPGAATAALLGASSYRIPMPLTVNIDFQVAGCPGARRHLWMTASPQDSGTCRTFWIVARNDEHYRPDREFLDFQDVVLAEDEPVVCNQVPAEIPLNAGEELDVKADRVSMEYRRWLKELALAGRSGPEALDRALGGEGAAIGARVSRSGTT
jgi:phenylpropionate dioxygenase-like ring-hydroxylating dioxygenase large terminal subunit